MKERPPLPQMEGMTSMRTPKGLAFIPTDESMREWLRQIEAGNMPAADEAAALVSPKRETEGMCTADTSPCATVAQGTVEAAPQASPSDGKPETIREKIERMAILHEEINQAAWERAGRSGPWQLKEPTMNDETNSFWHWGAHAFLGVAVVVLGAVAALQQGELTNRTSGLGFARQREQAMAADLAKARSEAEDTQTALEAAQDLASDNEAKARQSDRKLAEAEDQISALTVERDAALAAANQESSRTIAARAEAVQTEAKLKALQSQANQVAATNAQLREQASYNYKYAKDAQIDAENAEKSAAYWRGQAARRSDVQYVPVAPDYSALPMRIQVEHVQR